LHLEKFLILLGIHPDLVHECLEILELMLVVLVVCDHAVEKVDVCDFIGLVRLKNQKVLQLSWLVG
jgi:hypothetical protein